MSSTAIPVGDVLEVSPKITRVIEKLHETHFDKWTEFQLSNQIMRAGLLQLVGRAERETADFGKKIITMRALGASQDTIDAVVALAERKLASLAQLRQELNS